MHEYARARAQDAAEALAEAEAAVAKAGSSSTSAASESSPSPALASLVALRDRLSQASEEAAAFAELTRADAERAKRSAAAAAEAAASGANLLPPPEGRGGGALSAADASAAQEDDEDEDVDMETSAAGPDAKRARESAGEEMAAAEATDSSSVPAAAPLSSSSSSSPSSQTMLERARYIPLRLTADERRMLALLKAALGVSQARTKAVFFLTLFSFFFFCPSVPFFPVSRSSLPPPRFALSLSITRTHQKRPLKRDSTPTRSTSSRGGPSRPASPRR